MFYLSKKPCFYHLGRRPIKTGRHVPAPLFIEMHEAIARSMHDNVALQTIFKNSIQALNTLHNYGIFHNNLEGLKHIFIHPAYNKVAFVDFKEASQPTEQLAFEMTDVGALLHGFGVHAGHSLFCQMVRAVHVHAQGLHAQNRLPLDHLDVSNDWTVFTFRSAKNIKEMKIEVLYDPIKYSFTCIELL